MHMAVCTYTYIFVDHFRCHSLQCGELLLWKMAILMLHLCCTALSDVTCLEIHRIDAKQSMRKRIDSGDIAMSVTKSRFAMPRLDGRMALSSCKIIYDGWFQPEEHDFESLAICGYWICFLCLHINYFTNVVRHQLLNYSVCCTRQCALNAGCKIHWVDFGTGII